MIYLVLTSLLWAASFGLIKRHLAELDAVFVAWARLGLALLVFLPFTRPLKRTDALRLVALGALQYGLMYVLYIRSYHYLQAYEVALFTALTPLHVVLIDGFLERRLSARAVIASSLAVLAAGVLTWQSVTTNAAIGFGLVQAANFCFAAGQLAYRRMALTRRWRQRSVFGWLYVGAFLFTTLIAASQGSLTEIDITSTQLRALIYLGVVASGAGFFMWNYGATRTSTTKLAVVNNLKAPLAVLIALTFFGEEANLWTLAICIALLGVGLFVARGQGPAPQPAKS